MRMLKKALSLFLCVVLLAAFVPYVHAAEKKPVVFVAGYTSARLYMDRGTPDEKRVWKQDVAGKIVEAVKSELPKIALEAGPAAVGVFDPLFDTLEPYVNEVIEPLRMNDDGSSKYNVEVYPHAVADTRLDRLREIGYYPDHDSLVALGKAAGEKNVYCCTLDWRLGQVDNAAVLDAYIRDVLKATGADKVDLMGVSYGGQVCGSYLSLYGGDAVRRVVLQCPALDGSSIVPQLLSGDDFTIAWEDLLELVRAYKKDEKAYGALSTLVPNEFFCRFLRAFLDRFLIDFFNNFGSVWDLVPRADYPALRDKLLLDGNHDEMIRKSDLYHNEISANIAQTFRRLRSEGVDIAIVAGYGWALAVDNRHTSDGVIDTASMTGAECALLGETLPVDRLQSTTVSADGTVDAANAYLPDRTWFVSGLLHSMAVNEEKVGELMMTLLLTDSIDDVHSTPEYPQFMTSQNACRGVFCAFEGCADGYCTKYGVRLQITNVCKTDSITVDGVSCSGADLRFGYTRDTTLQPGETLTVTVSGKLPDDLSIFRVNVRFVVYKDKYSLGRSRTQDFRFAGDSHEQDVLTEDASTAETIADTPAVRNGVLPFKAVLGRLFTFFLNSLLAIVSILHLQIPRNAF